jgi:hypothetical protein
MKGTYQHCAEKHLHRYLAAFDFRYNNREKLGVNDLARAMKQLISGTKWYGPAAGGRRKPKRKKRH